MTEPKGPVLVVDDDADVREAIRDTLEQEGYVAAEARDGGEALSYLRSNAAPSLILLDWNMAPMNAPQFMEEFANHPGSDDIPVVLLTADARVEQKAQGKGYVGFIKKPVKLQLLFDMLQRYCA
ncbi:MAG TPA: response regulator [Polyangiaceae bacterium]